MIWYQLVPIIGKAVLLDICGIFLMAIWKLTLHQIQDTWYFWTVGIAGTVHDPSTL